MTKYDFIKKTITSNHAFIKKEQEFLLKNLDKFSDFVKTDAETIYDYSDLSIQALRVLINNGLEVDAMKSMNNINSFLRRNFENFCIAIAMGEI
jgi:hypothetical protein